MTRNGFQDISERPRKNIFVARIISNVNGPFPFSCLDTAQWLPVLNLFIFQRDKERIKFPLQLSHCCFDNTEGACRSFLQFLCCFFGKYRMFIFRNKVFRTVRYTRRWFYCQLHEMWHKLKTKWLDDKGESWCHHIWSEQKKIKPKTQQIPFVDRRTTPYLWTRLL